MKKFVYVVMMNYDPMGGQEEWHTFKAFDNRRDAQLCINEMWEEEFGSHDEDTYNPPIDMDEWLKIEQVEMG